MPARSATSSFLAHPYQLVSLLDMKPLSYTALCNVLGLLSLHSHLRSDSSRVEADDRLHLRAIELYVQEMGLAKSLTLVKRMRVEFEGDGRTGREFSERAKVLQERIRDDLDELVFLYIPGDRAGFYNNHKLFGDQVATNFSDANFDIEEAGKSFALDRHTACVMHLMRSLEVALDAVGRGVGLSNPVVEAQNNWGGFLVKIDGQIIANDKAALPDWPLKRQFFVDARAHLFSVKNAWRNPSMHLEKKYTEAEAERIFRAVKDFMEHLATHLDQAGNFTP